jgi:hypothetical protein
LPHRSVWKARSGQEPPEAVDSALCVSDTHGMDAVEWRRTGGRSHDRPSLPGLPRSADSPRGLGGLYPSRNQQHVSRCNLGS